MNEPLYRALVQARLREEDVAARLDVDPKTVRRWLEGRVPYLRHRWALAAMLGRDEADLWPELRTLQQRPDEVRGIYPRLDAVPAEVWVRLFGSAQREIAILTDSMPLLAEDDRILETLISRVRAGVSVRICLAGSDVRAAMAASERECRDGPADSVRTPLSLLAPLQERGRLEVRVHRGALYHLVYRSDSDLLVAQRAYGIPTGQIPVLQLHQTAVRADLAGSYLDAFEVTWTGARRRW